MSDNSSKHFYCKPCGFYYVTEAWLDEDGVTFSSCENCGKAVSEIPNGKEFAYKGAAAAMGKHTGPKTAAGKAAAAEKRKGTYTGPNTAKGKERSSLNNYKHGLYSQKAHLLAPALKDKFPECDGCNYRAECGVSLKYCVMKVQPMLETIRAYKEGDAEALKLMAGFQQANVNVVLDMMWKQLFKHGVLNPKVINAKVSDDGDKEEIVMEWQDNPILKHIPKYMEMAGFNAEQQAITPKVAQDQENMDAFLGGKTQEKENIQDFMKEMAEKVGNISKTQELASKARNEDAAIMQLNAEKDLDAAS